MWSHKEDPDVAHAADVIQCHIRPANNHRWADIHHPDDPTSRDDRKTNRLVDYLAPKLNKLARKDSSVCSD